ncbi:MAG TPA: hypothetical protein VKB55_12860 [Nocardioidaceae bacterium]|nr:hypothetical protein [Nocardioidaceae bacterium]
MPGADTSTHDVLWSPPSDVRDTTRIGDYLDWLRRRTGQEFDDYAALWEWSVGDPNAFWLSVWDYFDPPADTRPTVGLADDSMPGAV